MKTKVAEHTINASGRTLGRLATEIVFLLRGKDRIDFAPNRVPAVRVRVTHADDIRLTGKKFEQKQYFRHSGYPGGAKLTPFKILFRRDSRLAVKRAVSGMLPKNKLRPRLLKQLDVYSGEAS